MLHKNWLLLGMSLLAFPIYIDFTIVSTVLPAIQKDLSASVIQLQWMMNVFFLGLCVLMTTMGRLGDILDRRTLLYIGAVIFGIASLGCGLSNNPGWLIFFRALQGASGAICLPVSMALLSTSFPADEKGKALGIYNGITGMGLAIGPVLGGLIVNMVSWRWIFLMNIPIIILGLFICFKNVRKSIKLEPKQKIDWLGAFLLMVTIGSFVVGILQIEFIYFFIFLFSLSLFLFTESKAIFPIIPLDLFKNHLFLAAIITMFAGGWFMAVVFFINPLYLSNIQHHLPYLIGLLLFVITIMEIIATLYAGRMVDRFNARLPICLGIICLCTSALLHITLKTNSALWQIILAFIPFGIAWGIINVAPAAAVAKYIAENKAGVAIGALYTFYNIGASVGLAISTALFHFAGHDAFMKGYNWIAFLLFTMSIIALITAFLALRKR